jgi:phage terminase Nu1 subunit (DNA packaging protein)
MSMVSRSEIAAIFGKSEETIYGWQKEGMPIEQTKRGRIGNTYDTARCIEWYAIRMGGGDGYDYNAERARLTHHQANLAQLEEEVKRGAR